MPRIIRRPAAKRDLVEHFVFIGETSGVEAAHRFLESANATLEELSRMPEMGALRRFPNPKFADVRMWRMKDFEKHLIFYRPVKDGILLLRVVHASRDIESLFRS